ncbi:MAG: cytidine deaminase [Planctomycetota bacterium]|nr:cytidine deaminase [Planctomycetota bacterium]
MNDTQREMLVSAALAAHARAYAPYSKFAVGAALLCADGTVVSGCNVENVSFGLSNCAERSAVFSAVSQGHKEFVAIAVASSGAFSPCGACRQVLAEFCRDLQVLLVDATSGQITGQTTLNALLPQRFEW